MADGPQGLPAYLSNLAVAADLSFNALLGGSAHGTFSARCWRARCTGKRWGRWCVAALDHVIGSGHCWRANVREAEVLLALARAEQAFKADA